MATPFSRTTRSLRQDTLTMAWISWACALLMLLAWLAWFIFGQVTLYLVSQSARLEMREPALALATLPQSAQVQAGQLRDERSTPTHAVRAPLIPNGPLWIAAEFLPADALGRIRPGQRASLRLDGFPWTEYGSLEAQVQQVATDVHGRTVRVELALLPAPTSRIPLQHGQPGSVEIATEHIAPAGLLWRTLGQWSRSAGER